MKPGLKIGDAFEFSTPVRPDMQARFEDGVVHPLYATAAMITHMEWAARQHILPYLEAGEEGVGYHVDVKHLNPTPIGATVRVRSQVTAVRPNRVTSQVAAWHEDRLIGEGWITQAIVPLEKLHSRYPATAAAQPDTPSSAVELGSADGQNRFSLELLHWETALLPCTRYDEWLVCRLQLNDLVLEGPFLLRYELEEWLSALESPPSGQATPFQSDFLEPVLKIRMPADGSLTLTLSPPGSDPAAAISACFLLDDSRRQALAQALARQLEVFPSRL